MHDLLTWVQSLPTLWIYLVAALIVAGETAVIFGLLVPGEATLLLVGFLTYNGTLRLGPALLAMIVAAVAGDGLAFRAGRRYGPRLRAG
ncbi:DedA family protein, partial [Micromonospora chokoriensis]